MIKQALKYVHVDAFTRTPYKGNPAAVFVLPNELSTERMQLIARELHLSETAFVRRTEPGRFSLRWFTPSVEVELCGHATLASAHVLWTEGHLGHADPAVFDTLSGPLECRKRADHVSMSFPSRAVEPFTNPPAEVRALFPRAVQFGFNGGALLVELETEAEVKDFAPDFARIAAPDFPGEVLIITARSRTPLRDFVSRVFVPKHGIPEDPVTGSAHCALGPYWMEKLGLESVRGEQISARTGVVHVAPGDAPGRVILSGQAVTIAKGILTVLP